MAPQQSEITDEESKAIETVNFDHLVGDGNDAFHNEPVVEPKKKGGKKKPVEVSPAQQALDGKVAETEPDITDPEWTDFCIRQLTEDEQDEEGNPYVHGLRRILQKLMGPILLSSAHTVQAPRFIDGSGMMLQPATVEYTLRFLNTRTPEGIEPYVVEYADVADVYVGNTDAMYARHPSATAATKAEGRCYRKALGLKRIISSEESTSVPLEEAGLDGLITPTQINFIDLQCRRLKIDVMKYINLGANKYDRIEHVSYDTAAKMNKHLSTLTNDPSKVSDDILGYKIDWMNRE